MTLAEIEERLRLIVQKFSYDNTPPIMFDEDAGDADDLLGEVSELLHAVERERVLGKGAA